ncbi:protein FAM237B-like [Hoplias malabaricus]|uniref:protein FAM237B-like n=1 Tax=Hoplias malabaricus TaxID=27720 RepID=UPI0034629362
MDACARFLAVRWRRVAGVCALLLAAVSCTRALSPPAVLGAVIGAPASLGQIDGACWDASSVAVMEAREVRVVDNVRAFWDFMTYLRASPQPGHHQAFMKLAQLFWERYVDCVLSRAHGLGRRRTGV